jgi:hypothetical protein
MQNPEKSLRLNENRLSRGHDKTHLFFALERNFYTVLPLLKSFLTFKSAFFRYSVIIPHT